MAVFIILTCQATTITVSNNADAGSGSLRAAAASANSGDTIRFSPSIIISGSDSIVLTTGEIDFGNKAITIKGLYSATDSLFISGGNNFRIFSFEGAGKVVLDSLILMNGNGVGAKSSGFGGAICYLDGIDTLFISNSIVKNNTITGNGGAVYSNSLSSSVSINNSNLCGNRSNSRGGAVYSESPSSSSVFISNSYLSGNQAKSRGGAVYSSSTNSRSSVTVNNSIINENIVSFHGGGIYSFSSSSTSFVAVNNSTISRNSASDGGGIYSNTNFDTSCVILSNSNLSENTADNGGGVYSNSFSSHSVVVVGNTTLNGNTAINGSGGGVYSYSGNSSVIINNSTLNGNTAEYGGGVSTSSTNSVTITVSNSTLTGNTGAIHGGGVWINSTNQSPTVTVSKSTFSGNTADNGGGVYSNSGSFTPSSIINIGSSIFDRSSISNQGNNTITSNGYNIFTDTPTGSVSTDFINVLLGAIKLGQLADNGGPTKTMLPGVGSIAIDMGDPIDMNDAQNGPISGVRRDVGAAESICIPTSSNFSVTTNQCNSYSVPSGDETYTELGTYTINDTINNAGGCDSVMTITITINSLMDQTVTAGQVTLCDTGATTIELGSSEIGVDYFLRNDDNNSIIVGPLVGTGNGLSFNTGVINSTTSYNVYGSLRNNALQLDGLDDFVQTNENMSNAGAMPRTFEWWAVTSANTSQYMISTGAASQSQFWAIRKNSNGGTLMFHAYSNDLNTSYVIDTNWHHYAVTYDGSNFVMIYVDGVLIDSLPAGLLNTAVGPLQIGSYLSTTQTFNGAMDEVRVWDYAKTATQIMDEKDIELSGSESGLVAYYDFNQGVANGNNATETTLLDRTSNANNGTLQNMAVSGAASNWIANSNAQSACVYEMTQTATVALEVVDHSVTEEGPLLMANESSATYQWLNCPGMTPIAGETDQSYDATINGSYAVIVTKNACADTSGCYQVTTVDIVENSFGSELLVYPNPTEGNLVIDLGNNNTSVNAAISDLSGNVLHKQTNNGSQLLRIQLNQPIGMYLLTIQSANEKAVIRLVKN